DLALLALLVRRIRLAPAGLVGPEDVVVPLLDGACGVDDYEVREQEGLSVRGGADLLVSEARDAPVLERDDDLAILVASFDALRSQLTLQPLELPILRTIEPKLARSCAHGVLPVVVGVYVSWDPKPRPRFLPR